MVLFSITLLSYIYAQFVLYDINHSRWYKIYRIWKENDDVTINFGHVVKWYGCVAKENDMVAKENDKDVKENDMVVKENDIVVTELIVAKFLEKALFGPNHEYLHGLVLPF